MSQNQDNPTTRREFLVALSALLPAPLQAQTTPPAQAQAAPPAKPEAAAPTQAQPSAAPEGVGFPDREEPAGHGRSRASLRLV